MPNNNTSANQVSFVKKATTKVVGKSNAEPLTDEIFATLSKSNQLIIVIAETYTSVVPTVVKYTNGYGISSDTIDAVAAAMQL